MSGTDIDWAKVHFTDRDGFEVQVAYVDPETGFGTMKHSDVPVILEWRDDHWAQVDDWEWKWRYDEFYRTADGKSAAEVEREELAARRASK